MALALNDLGKLNINSDTGAGAIADSILGDGIPRKILGVAVHLSAAPSTAGSLTITKNDNLGAAYDLNYVTQSMVGVVDFIWQPNYDIWLTSGDTLDIAYANSDARTFGLEVVAMEM